MSLTANELRIAAATLIEQAEQMERADKRRRHLIRFTANVDIVVTDGEIENVVVDCTEWKDRAHFYSHDIEAYTAKDIGLNTHLAVEQYLESIDARNWGQADWFHG